MIEEVLVTARHNAKIDPSLDIWTWEISFYLFMGGMTAGIMLFVAYAVLSGRREQLRFAHDRLALLAPIVLSLGMTTLFLDLEYKLHVFRFYMDFVPTSPMSWGAWILILIYPLMVLQTLSTLRAGYPTLAGWVERIPAAGTVLDLLEHRRRLINWVIIPFAVGLGIYTGVLLSALSARPFWNSGALGPLFLASALGAAAALAFLGARQREERGFFALGIIGFVALEIVLVGLFVISLATGSQQHMQALELVLEGDHVQPWLFLLGLLVPIVLAALYLKGHRLFGIAAAAVVLYDGYMLRYHMVELGQLSTWIDYAHQVDPQLLQRLTQ